MSDNTKHKQASERHEKKYFNSARISSKMSRLTAALAEYLIHTTIWNFENKLYILWEYTRKKPQTEFIHKTKNVNSSNVANQLFQQDYSAASRPFTSMIILVDFCRSTYVTNLKSRDTDG